ncbi:MAG: hypothetical protein ACLR1T_04220 [Evtepia gabavorous]
MILGLAGPGEPSKKHVEETIRVLNRMQANHVSCLSYMPEPNSPMYQDVKEGRFQMITPGSTWRRPGPWWPGSTMAPSISPATTPPIISPSREPCRTTGRSSCP